MSSDSESSVADCDTQDNESYGLKKKSYISVSPEKLRKMKELSTGRRNPKHKKRYYRQEKVQPVVLVVELSAKEKALEAKMKKYTYLCRKCDICDKWLDTQASASLCLKSHGLKRCFACFEIHKRDTHASDLHMKLEHYSDIHPHLIECPFCNKPQRQCELEQHVNVKHHEDDINCALLTGSLYMGVENGFGDIVDAENSNQGNNEESSDADAENSDSENSYDKNSESGVKTVTYTTNHGQSYSKLIKTSRFKLCAKRVKNKAIISHKQKCDAQVQKSSGRGSRDRNLSPPSIVPTAKTNNLCKDKSKFKDKTISKEQHETEGFKSRSGIDIEEGRTQRRIREPRRSSLMAIVKLHELTSTQLEDMNETITPSSFLHSSKSKKGEKCNGIENEGGFAPEVKNTVNDKMNGFSTSTTVSLHGESVPGANEQGAKIQTEIHTESQKTEDSDSEEVLFIKEISPDSSNTSSPRHAIPKNSNVIRRTFFRNLGTGKLDTDVKHFIPSDVSSSKLELNNCQNTNGTGKYKINSKSLPFMQRMDHAYKKLAKLENFKTPFHQENDSPPHLPFSSQWDHSQFITSVETYGHLLVTSLLCSRVLDTTKQSYDYKLCTYNNPNSSFPDEGIKPPIYQENIPRFLNHFTGPYKDHGGTVEAMSSLYYNQNYSPPPPYTGLPVSNPLIFQDTRTEKSFEMDESNCQRSLNLETDDGVNYLFICKKCLRGFINAKIFRDHALEAHDLVLPLFSLGSNKVVHILSHIED